MLTGRTDRPTLIIEKLCFEKKLRDREEEKEIKRTRLDKRKKERKSKEIERTIVEKYIWIEREREKDEKR